jgi:predicted phage tail protein
MLLPGDVCLILDPLKTGMVSGGRIKGVSNTSISTDRELSKISYSGNYQLYIYGPSGVASKYTVSSVSTSGSITITGGFGSNKPSTMDMWGLVKEATDRQHHKEPMYRVQSVKEEGDGTYTVVGIKYDKTKFPYVNGGDSATLKSGSYGSRSYSASRRLTMNAKSISFSLRTPD